MSETAGLLANPIWSSLATTHARFALGSGRLKRFAPDVGPFCAVERDGVDLGGTDDLHSGETVYFLGTIPKLAPDWILLGEYGIQQMVYVGSSTPEARAPDASALGGADIPAMLELTAQVYPDYFRARTAVLGNYIGVHGPGRLDAMAGQRFACTGYREISSVCTHPSRRGQGLAGNLIRQQSCDILAEGRIPFLHVSASNQRAWALYESLGFVPTRELRLVKVLIG